MTNNIANQIQKNDWLQVQLEEVADVLIGGTPSRNKSEYWDVDKESQNVWVSISDLSSLTNHYIENSKEFITDLGAKNSNVKLIPANTVLMSFKLSIGKTAITKRPLYTNEAIAAFAIKKPELINEQFLFHVLPLLEYDKDVAVKGSTLNKEKLRNTKLILPPMQVQQKIAQILSAVDLQLEHANKVIQNTTNLKKELMKELFMKGIGHKKFKQTKLGEVPYEWNIESLGKVATVERGKFSHRPRNAPEFYGGDIPFIQTGDVVSSNGRIKVYSQTLNEKGLKVSKMFKKGTIVLTIAANIGDTGILEFDACFPDSLVGITPLADLNPVYLEHFLQSRKEYLNSISTQSAQKNINLAKLNPMLIAIPSLSEQEKIVDILVSLDQELSLERETKESLLILKKGIVSDIFNRKVQIIV